MILKRVYQIDPQLDMNYAMYKPYACVDEVDPAIYRKVFDSELEFDSMDDIYTRFNTVMHPLYNGRSLTRSDVIVTDEGTYYVDSVGFRPIEFNEELTNSPDQIRILFVEPHKEPVEAFIPNTLDAKQHAVGGLIEYIFNADDTAIICDEESKLKGKEGNRYLDDGGIIAGNFFVEGLGEETCRSLTDKEIAEYKAKYSDPPNISPEETAADVGIRLIRFM